MFSIDRCIHLNIFWINIYYFIRTFIRTNRYSCSIKFQFVDSKWKLKHSKIKAFGYENTKHFENLWIKTIEISRSDWMATAALHFLHGVSLYIDDIKSRIFLLLIAENQMAKSITNISWSVWPNNEARYTTSDTHWAMYSNGIFNGKKNQMNERMKQSKSIRGDQIEYTQFILTLALLLLNGLTGNTGYTI